MNMPQKYKYQLFTSLLLVFLLVRCDQVPTTLDEDPYIPGSSDSALRLELVTFEFDFLSKVFFFSVEARGPDSINVLAELQVGNKTIETFSLNDLGLKGDIQINDHMYDYNWPLPDTLGSTLDSLWTLHIQAKAGDEIEHTSYQLRPERPAVPTILGVAHLDTLTLPENGFVFDTLVVEMSHPKGLDEIRDVSMMSLKPDGNYANNGQPILLHDDGGRVIFFSFGGIDFTSGDKVAGDGNYSLLLPLEPASLSGKYYWTFNARTWLGMLAEPVQDSLIVLSAPGLSAPIINTTLATGVFQ